MKFQVGENFGEVGALTLADRIQSPERRIQNRASRLFLFSVSARDAGQAERPNQRRNLCAASATPSTVKVTRPNAREKMLTRL